jgi:nucleoside-diphosphate-sugar epimerase
MNVLVVGGAGATGRLVVEELVARGHRVTAFVRDRRAEPATAHAVAVGDATQTHDVHAAVRGQDAVIVTLGIREHPLLVRLRGTIDTPMDVRSRGTALVVEAMRQHGVPKVVVLSSYGVGDTRRRLSITWRFIFAAVLRPQIADTERQEQVVRSSGLTWVLAQPVALTDAEAGEPAFASRTGEVRGMSVSRRSVARFLADAVEPGPFDCQAVALS